MIYIVFNVIFAVVAYLALSLVLAAFENKFISQPRAKRQNANISVRLGVPVDELYSEGNREKLFKYLTETYDSDRLVNRISDVAGVLLNVVGWVANLVIVGVAIFIVYVSVTEDSSDIVRIWFLLLALPFSMVVYAVVDGCVWLLTGRHAGQAATVRRALQKEISSLGQAKQ